MYKDCTFNAGDVTATSGNTTTFSNKTGIIVGTATNKIDDIAAADERFNDDWGDGTSAPVNTSNTSSGVRGWDTSSGGRGQYGRTAN